MRKARSGELHLNRDEVAGLLAHDLRTPLAAISMNLDYVLAELQRFEEAPLSDDGDAGGVRAALEDCRQANVRAVRLVSDMADAVQLLSGERRPNFSEVDGAHVMAEVIRRIAPEAATRDVEIAWMADSESFRADADLLTRALERVVQRALWHTPCGGKITISLEAGGVELRVPGNAPPPGDPARSLAMHFAEAALRCQGGAVWTERGEEGDFLYRVKLP